jgi:hypothetical protein
MKKTILFLALGFLLTGQTLFAQVPSYVPTNGLVGYWPFNGNAYDESGNGNNGVNDGAILTSDRFGNSNFAYHFDGVSFITILNSQIFHFGTVNNFSTNIWFNRQSVNDNWHVIMSYACPNSGGIGGFQLGTTTNLNLEFGLDASAIYNGGNINNSSWHMLTATFDRQIDVIKIYQDGQYIGSISVIDSYSYTPTCNPNILIGGERNYWSQYYFNGDIDDIGIWNRALTDQEITNLYNSANTNECLTMVINTGVLSTTPVTYTSSVSIYPNPANDQITIDCGNLANVQGWSIKITNMLGQEVFNQPMNTQQYVVPLNTWTGQGMYFVKIINAQNEVVNIKKIILQ